MQKLKKPPLIIVAGPTAVGKSSLCVGLAKQIMGEVISADSMQVYRGMDIGTAKITREEMQGVPHHLIDILDPQEPFDVTVFQRRALEAIDSVLARGHLPILCGGTGFYIQSVLYKIQFTDRAEDPEIRRELERIAKQIGPVRLHEKLRQADPESADAIPAGNVKRVVRALEYYRTTGRPISLHNKEERERESAFHAVYFVLQDEREKLYKDINRRVDLMLQAGLEAEVRRLRQEGCRRGMCSMQGIGYRQMLDYLDGMCTLEEAADTIRKETRHFAKRQLTWLRREKDAIWLDKRDYPDQKALLQAMTEELSRQGIWLPATVQSTTDRK